MTASVAEPTNHTKSVSFGIAILEPGWTCTPHSHETEEEIWFVLSGTGQARVGEEIIQIEKGTAIHCAPGQPHQLINNGKEDMRVLWAFSSPGFGGNISDGKMGKHRDFSAWV